MTPHRRADAAGLAHEVWRQLCALAEQNPGEFTPETRDGDPGWLCEGPAAGLVGRAAPDAAQDDLQLAREYLKASGMLVDVRGHQSGGTQPTHFIRREWHADRTGNVRVIPEGTPHPPGPEPGQPPAAAAAGTRSEDLPGPAKDLQSRAGELAAENTRLQDEAEQLAAENARLRAENNRLRAAVRKVTELLSGLQDLATLQPDPGRGRRRSRGRVSERRARLPGAGMTLMRAGWISGSDRG